MLGNVIELARRQKKLSRVFFASTSEVYAGTLKNFTIEIPTKEITPLALTNLEHPRTAYMLSKIYGEAMCLQSKLPVTIFRPHNLYGPRMGMSHVIPEQLKKAYYSSDDKKLEVFNPDHTRAFCFIDDAIEIIFAMMKTESCVGKTLNLGTQTDEIKIADLVQICYSIVDRKIKMSLNYEDKGSPSRRAPDMTLTTELTGVESKINLEEGIQITYDWYRNNIFEGQSISAE
jgi:nucleoside-diphosphate-sugar epimerase